MTDKTDPLVKIGDSLNNIVASLGTDQDAITHSHYAPSLLSSLETASMYYTSGIAKIIVDEPANDMTREGREWTTTSATLKRIQKAEKDLGVNKVINRALKISRYSGGAGIIMVMKDNTDAHKPLDPDNVGKGDLVALHVLGKDELYAGTMDTDPFSPTYGEPLYYTVASTENVAVNNVTIDPATRVERGSVNIHPSRVIRFVGSERLEPYLNYNGWGDSILVPCRDAIRDAETGLRVVINMMIEAKLDVVQIPGLSAKAKDPAYREAMLQRFRLATRGKSVNNMLILDELEKYTQKTISFANIDKILNLMLDHCATLAHMPVTKFRGSSPGGLGSNGEKESRDYNDYISTKQEEELRPKFDKLDRIVFKSAGIATVPEYKFSSLWKMDDGMRADISLKKAQAAQVIAATGYVPDAAMAEAYQSSLVEDNTFPGMADALAKIPEDERFVRILPVPDGSKPGNPPANKQIG